MSNQSRYLDSLGSQIRRGQEPSIAELLHAIACTIDAGLDQINTTLQLGFAQLPHADRPDEDLEPDIDGDPPPDYGPPGSDAVIVEYPF